MISSSDRLHRYLRDFPELTDLLVQFRPVYRIFTLPILGDLLLRCMSVGMAARLGSVSTTDLASYLIRKTGEVAGCLAMEGDLPAKKNRGEKMWSAQDFFKDKTEIILDVRPQIMRGEDPFHDIMGALGGLQKDQYLLLINSFEPIPLFNKLKEKGFVFQSSQKGSIYYIKIARNSKEDKSENKNSEPDFFRIDEDEIRKIETRLSVENPAKIMYLDVSELPAPEPLMKIAEIISQNPAPLLVKVSHRKLPLHLPSFFKGKPYRVSAFERDEAVTIYIIHESLTGKL